MVELGDGPAFGEVASPIRKDGSTFRFTQFVPPSDAPAAAELLFSKIRGDARVFVVCGTAEKLTRVVHVYINYVTSVTFTKTLLLKMS